MSDKFIKGRGAQYNPHNRFGKQEYVEEHIEGLDEPLLTHPQRQIIQEYPKTIISKSDSPDLRNMLSINPYRGCEHGCIYCYARNSHEYWGYSAGLDFETKIMVKSEAPQLLERTFLKKSWKPQTIALSGNTDCYQPLERELKITRKLLEVCLKYGNPVSIITKNALIARDLDLLKELSKENLVHVWFSINSQDETLKNALEPRTARLSKRIATMKKLSDAGIPCAVMMAPIIPGLNDHEIPLVMKNAAEAGALSAGYTMVRLNGAIGPIFQDWILKAFPDRADKVLNLIKETHGGSLNDSRYGIRMKGEGRVAKSINQLFHIMQDKYLKNRKMPAYDLTRFRKNGNYNLFSNST